jgi:acyl-CoA thioester hydrolase
MSLPRTSVELEVPFHDVDPLHVVWHGHYYKYMEIARTQLLRALGLDGREMIELGYTLYVIESRCRYAFPLRYGERFRVTAEIIDIDNRINISYEIFNLTQGRRSARGKTALVTTDIEGNMFLETPDVVRRKLVA